MNNYPYQTLTRSNVTVSGQGQQALVLLHGLGCNQTLWYGLLPAFEPHYRVILLDLIGCGDSQVHDYSRERYGSLEGHADDLLDVLCALNVTGAIFIGHSIGAMIGVIAAVREPERFANLVLVSPSPRFLNGRDYTGGYEREDLEEMLAYLEADQDGWSQSFAPLVVGESSHPDLLMAFSNSFARTNPEVLRHFARVAFLGDSRAELPLLTTPVLIIQSARDVLAPLAVGHYINEQLADSHIAIIDTSGHCPHLTAPELTLAAIGKFLGRPLTLPNGLRWPVRPAAAPPAGAAPTPRVLPQAPQFSTQFRAAG